MTSNIGPVTAIFLDLVKQGHITPVAHVHGSLPGQLPQVPTITTYGTPDIPLGTGVHRNAQLAEDIAGNIRH